MGLIWLAVAGVVLWGLVRLGRQTERRGRGHWRVTATLMATAMIAGGVVAGARGGWVLALGLIGGGLWLVWSSRQRAAPVRPSEDVMSLREARETLGVPEGADTAAINAAWKRLMARAHPDQGGSQGLAIRLNMARDRLLKG